MLLGKDKIVTFRESDFFVLPSYSENFGMAVVEAMACESQVIITKGVGIFEFSSDKIAEKWIEEYNNLIRK